MARLILRAGLLALLLVAGAAAAFAQQSQAVRVTAREAEIRTRPDARSPLIGRAVTGAVLQVVATENNWYRVIVPPHARLVPTAPDQGYVDAKSVAVLQPGDPRAGMRTPPVAGQATAARARPKAGTAVRLFGAVSYERFQAANSFEAVFGSAWAPSFGGGVDVLMGRHLFIQGDVEYLQRTGERVFVFEDEVFPLGIDEKLKLTTIGISAGYRFGRGAGITPYVGGGAIVAIYREEATDAGASESLTDNGVGGQALVGLEFRLARWVSAAVEGRYRYIPGILGDAGVSKEYGENNLGGGAVAVKVIFGR